MGKITITEKGWTKEGKELSAMARLVKMLLKLYADRAGKCAISHIKMARELGNTPSATYQAVRELEAKKLVGITRRNWKSNIYLLKNPKK